MEGNDDGGLVATPERLRSATRRTPGEELLHPLLRLVAAFTPRSCPFAEAIVAKANGGTGSRTLTGIIIGVGFLSFVSCHPWAGQRCVIQIGRASCRERVYTKV